MAKVSPSRFKPAVARETLMLIAGLVWSVAGLMLLVWAVIWLVALPPLEAVLLGAAGVAIGLAAKRWMFAGIVTENIARIERAPIRACAFSFQAWKSYLLMAFMIALGIYLRRSGVIPRPALAVIYTAIGAALLLASLDYHRAFWADLRGPN